MWFKGIRGKLLVMIAIPILALTCISFISVFSTQDLNSSIKVITTDRIPKVTLLAHIRMNNQAILRYILSARLEFDNPEHREAYLNNAKVRMEEFDKDLNSYAVLPHPPEQKANLDVTISNWLQMQKGIANVIPVIEKGTHEAQEEARLMLIKSVVPHSDAIVASMLALETRTLDITKSKATNLDDSVTHIKIVIFITSLLGFIFSIAVGVLLATGLIRNLNGIVINISKSGSEVDSASEELSSSSQTLSTSATRAASALEQTVASIEELSSMVKLNADNAKQAAVLSESSSQSASEGEVEIKTLIAAMSDISQSSKKIEEIISVIDDIAFQTNLLALNAAVEAARAGDQGKGFAVVADAVRTLAQRSSAAAKDISSLIKESVEKVDTGTKVAAASESVLHNIVASVKKVTTLNGEIASASSEQATGIAQISQAMNELDHATEGNVSSAKNMTSSSSGLSSQAKTLHSLVGDLTQLIDGESKRQKPHFQQSIARPPSSPRATLGVVASQRPTSPKVNDARLHSFAHPRTKSSLSKTGTSNDS